MSGAKKGVEASRRSPVAESPEVEEMLRAAEDELLLKLEVGSHTISSSSSLDSDLARRFQALKSPRPPPHPKTSKGFESRDQIHGDVTGDDLMARFSALKTTNPISNRVDSIADEEIGDGDDGDEVSKKEVERVMQWAVDAARLDPSRSDDEDNDIVKQNNGLSESESESESEVEEKRRKVKEKGKSGKWFSFFR